MNDRILREGKQHSYEGEFFDFSLLAIKSLAIWLYTLEYWPTMYAFRSLINKKNEFFSALIHLRMDFFHKFSAY